MSERIKELAMQSGAWDHYEINEGVDGDEKPLEKFAELIVRECADVAGYYYTRNECVSPRQIKRHFGVEE